MSEKRIYKIFKERLNEDVVSISDSSHGVEQGVWIVKTSENRYVIKFPRRGNRPMIMREVFACEKMRGRLLSPLIILRGRDYLVESFLPGKMLSQSKLSKNEKAQVHAVWGKAVRELHGVAMNGFGELQAGGQGKHATLQRHVRYLMRRDFPSLVKTGLLAEKEITALRVYIRNNLACIDRDESVLLHCDLLGTNVLVHEKQFSGLIDFGDLSCGPRAYDLAKLYIEKAASDDFFDFLQGYGEIAMPEVEYFAVLHLLYEISYYHAHRDRQKTSELLQLLHSIVSGAAQAS